MVYLNFSNLDAETQQHLFSISRAEVESRYGGQLRQYAKSHELDYDELVEQACPEHGRREAIRNLYTYDYVFHI